MKKSIQLEKLFIKRSPRVVVDIKGRVYLISYLRLFSKNISAKKARVGKTFEIDEVKFRDQVKLDRTIVLGCIGNGMPGKEEKTLAQNVSKLKESIDHTEFIDDYVDSVLDGEMMNLNIVLGEVAREKIEWAMVAYFLVVFSK